MAHEITISEIAKCEGMNPNSVRRLAREKGFPDPVRTIGSNKIFDWRTVDRYFRERAKKSKKFKRSKAP